MMFPSTIPAESFDFGVVPRWARPSSGICPRRAEHALRFGRHDQRRTSLYPRPGARLIPELSFGADGGNFGTANGYGSLAGAKGRFDYNLFGDQFNTMGQGPTTTIRIPYRAQT